LPKLIVYYNIEKYCLYNLKRNIKVDLFSPHYLKNFLRRTIVSNLAPIAAVSFLWSETEQTEKKSCS